MIYEERQRAFNLAYFFSVTLSWSILQHEICDLDEKQISQLVMKHFATSYDIPIQPLRIKLINHFL